MKKYILMLSMFIQYFFVYAQEIKIKNSVSLEAISYAYLVLDDSTKINVGPKGNFEFASIEKSEQVRVYALGYTSKVCKMSDIKVVNVIYLTEKIIETEEVVISASKFEEKQSDVAQQIKIIKAEEIGSMNQSSTADLLQNSGYVNVQKSQMGGGSPVMRGFEANKIVLSIDGVRMNNAIYRGGHLQNVITIDNNMLERAEMVFGSGSVIYGSDALGGVIHFHTIKPELSSNDKLLVKAGAMYRMNTANNERTTHLKLNLGTAKFASLTGFTYSDFDDLRTGGNRNPIYGSWGMRNQYVKRVNGKDSIFNNSDPNKQIGTAYSQLDFLQKFVYQQSANLKHTLNIQLSNSSEIPRYDRLTDVKNGKLRYAEWYYGPQVRNMYSYQLEHHTQNLLYNHVRLTLAYQQIEESRNQRSLNSVWRQNRLEKVNVYSTNLDFAKQIAKHEIRYGLEYYYNKVNSTAKQTDITVDTSKALDTRYPDGGSQFNSMAAYITHTLEFNDKFIVSEGLRYSYYTLNSKFNNKTFFPFPFEEAKQSSSAFNGNLSVIYKPIQNLGFSVMANSGYRAPNVDDLAKVFESATGNLIVPNKDLKPEYTYNLELGANWLINQKVKLEAFVWNTWYTNAITLKPTLFNGQDSIMYNGKMSRVVSSQNVNDAFVRGYSLGMLADVNDNFSISQYITYTLGRFKTDTLDYPMDHIQPLYGKTSFILKLKNFKGEFFMVYNAAKEMKDFNLIGEDNQQYSLNTSKGYYPSWCTLNLRLMYSFNSNIHLQTALENILDSHYRMFASGVSAPGRNLTVTLKMNY